jgi:hypothetical protein
MSTLSPDQWWALSPYLNKALSLSGDARIAWLASLRSQDPVLAELIETLLVEHNSAEEHGFLQQAPIGVFDGGFVGQVVGAYKIVSLIGHGQTTTASAWRDRVAF